MFHKVCKWAWLNGDCSNDVCISLEPCPWSKRNRLSWICPNPTLQLPNCNYFAISILIWTKVSNHCKGESRHAERFFPNWLKTVLNLCCSKSSPIPIRRATNTEQITLWCQIWWDNMDLLFHLWSLHLLLECLWLPQLRETRLIHKFICRNNKSYLTIDNKKSNKRIQCKRIRVSWSTSGPWCSEFVEYLRLRSAFCGLSESFLPFFKILRWMCIEMIRLMKERTIYRDTHWCSEFQTAWRCHDEWFFLS